MDKPMVIRSHDRVEKPGVSHYSIDKKINYDLYAETGDIEWDTKPFIKTVKGATVLKNIKSGTYDIRNFDLLNGWYFMSRPMIIRSHDKIEKSGVDYYHVDKDLDYDLYEKADSEAGKFHGSFIKTVKGSAVLRNIESADYFIANCNHVTNPIARIGRYYYDVNYEKNFVHTLGVIDFSESGIEITDKGLNGIELSAEKIDDKHFFIGINQVIIDFETETIYYPHEMFEPGENNVLTAKIGDKEIEKYSLMNQGRIIKAEFQRRDKTYMLRLYGRCESEGPLNDNVGGTLTLEQGIVYSG